MQTCPKCKGKNIVGVEYPGIYDGVIEWRCLDCGYRQHRFTGKELKNNELPKREFN